MKIHPLFLAVFGLILPISLARADTFTVINNDDGGPGSFRAAIEGVNSRSGPDNNLIVFSGDAKDIVLQGALPTIHQRVEIRGQNKALGVNVTVRRLSTAPAFRLMDFSADNDASLTEMNLVGGNATDGGLIHNSGVLSFYNCTLSGGNAVHGGAVYNEVKGTIFFTNTDISNNQGEDGGAIFNEGYIEVYTSVLSGNSAKRGGATESFYAPEVGGSGGAVRFFNSTLTGNSATQAGGAAYASSSSLSFDSCTVVGNTAPASSGAGLHVVGPYTPPGEAVFYFENTILAGNTPQGGGTVYRDLVRENPNNNYLDSRGHNLFGFIAGSPNPFTAIGDQSGFNRATAGVADLADNGGPTRTMALLASSPAVDAGSSRFTVDQRGAGRPFGNQKDIGAYEGVAGGDSAPVASPTNYATTVGQLISFKLSATDVDNDSLTYRIIGRALPAGWTLDPETGIVSGTTNELLNGVTYEFQVSDGKAVSNSTLLIYVFEASSLTVTTVGKANRYDGLTSLSEAVDAAGGQGGLNKITFDLPQGDHVIELDEPMRTISQNTSIVGPSTGGVTIKRSTASGTPQFSLFQVVSGAMLTLKNLTLSGGDAGELGDSPDPLSPEGRGGAVVNVDSFLQIENCTFTGNTAAQGGAIYSVNEGQQNSVNIVNSTLTGNIATATAGQGISEILTGGGIAVAKGSVSLESCTLVGNRAATGTGAGISSVSDGSALVHVSNSIIAGNLTAQGAADSNTDLVALSLPATANAFSSGGGNVVGGGNGVHAFTAANDLAKVSSADLKLGALAQNGGPTATMALLFGSPAVDRSNTTLLTDQRGESRPYGKAADSGAFEVHNFAPTLKSLTLTPDAPFQNDTLTATVEANDPDGTTPTLTYTWTKTRNGKSTILRTSGNTLPTSGQDIVVGDTIIVTVVASDGVSTSSPLSASVTIRNHPISISSLSLQPKNPYTNEQMVATVKTVDADKTRPFYSFYWTCNGMAVQSMVNSRSSQDFYNLNLSGHGDKRDLIEVTVVVSDGSSTATAKTNARVLNSIPTISALSLAPQAPLPTGIVTATYAGRDADGDILTKIYQWKIGKKVLVTEKGSRLNLANYPATKPGDVISCTMRLSDGESLSKTLLAQVTVAGPMATPALTAPVQGDSSSHSS